MSDNITHLAHRKVNIQIWVLFWIALLVGLWAFVTLFQSILAPFVLGLLVAYFFQPVVTAMVNRDVPRGIAIAVIILGFAILFTLAIAIVVPAVIRQALNLIEAAPGLLDRMQNDVLPLLADELALMGIDSNELFGSSGQLFEQAGSTVRNWLAGASDRLSAVFSTVAFVILTPIVSIYMLNDWQSVTTSVKNFLPRSISGTVVDLASAIDKSVSRLLRGLFIVALIMSVFYTTLFFMVGFSKYALLFGILTGFFVFVPYLGPISATVIGTSLAFIDSGSTIQAALVLGVFLAGQGIEGYFVTPRLVGREVGLHPVWIIFSLLGGGAVGGLPGFLIAMPTAAAMVAAVRFGLNRYQQSRLYNENDETELNAFDDSKFVLEPESDMQ